MREEEYKELNISEKSLVKFIHKFTTDNEIHPHNVKVGHGPVGGTYMIRGKEKEYDKDSFLMEVSSEKWILLFIPSSENEIELFKIEVNDRYRKSGVGTEVLNLILDTSDELNIGLKLLPYSYLL